MKTIYSADFETTTNAEDCRVWAWALADIERPDNPEVGTTLDMFMDRVSCDTSIIYFHNLKFDGGFIIDWLFRNGYEHVIQERGEHGKLLPLKPGQMTSVISDMGQWYALTVVFKDTGNKVTFKDSLKLIPLPVAKIPNAYGLPDKKLEIDYKADRSIGWKLTPEEIEYVKADVVIVAKAIKIMMNEGQTKMTAASNALHDFKTRFGKKRFQKIFPELPVIQYDENFTVDTDKEIRQSYKGGWTYLNPIYADKPVMAGRVYDINSMYPWAMHDCLLPYGYPVGFKGKPYPKEGYPLFVVQIVASFKLKPGKWPSIQLKNVWGFSNTEYVTETTEEQGPVLLTLTDVDYRLFLHNYDVDIYEYIGGYYFKGKIGMFAEFIDYWYTVKTTAKKDGNPGMAQIAKLMLNSLYGKFGSRREGYSKIPYFDTAENKVKYKPGDLEKRNGVYIPVATFITSYCRDKIIRAAETCYDRFIYADTDSLHVIGDYDVAGLDVDDYRLGAFKHESTFKRARFIRSKTYMEIQEEEFTDYDGYTDTEEVIDLKCAGMPSRMKETVREKDFYMGAKFPVGPGSRFQPKLVPLTVPGGVILREMPFEIR